jgi:hypothetical protein
LHNYVRKVTGYGWGNSHWIVTNSYGDTFTFILSGKHLTIWEYSGDIEVAEASLVEDLKERRKQVNNLLSLLDKFSLGTILCSGCNKECKLEEIKSHRFYSGIYCDECWEKKYKHAASIERYD